MSQLLQGRFSPVTNHVGFIAAPLAAVEDLLSVRDPGQFTRIRVTKYQDALPAVLAHMAPFHQIKILVGDTQSLWTALFANSCDSTQLRVLHCVQELKCSGLDVTHIPDTFSPENRTGRLGGTGFDYMQYSESDDCMDQVLRSVMAHREPDGAWLFHESGNPMPFENVARYQSADPRDRFTIELLVEYLQALGIRLLDERFYGPRFSLVNLGLTNALAAATYAEARALFGMLEPGSDAEACP